VQDAHYKLEDPEAQIKPHVSDGIRAKVPAMTLAEVFEGKDEIAKYVKAELVATMAAEEAARS
jgi:regulator of protease activity HflC (stomatin/prohibitin superfamily)